jgi:histone-lysine N-methyltransferase SETD1
MPPVAQASILGLNSGKKGGDSAMSALTFNDLTSRKKKVRLAKSAIHSWGLYAAEPIDADDFVVEYIGEYVRASVAELRERKYRRLGYGDDYIFRVDADTLVDATRMGGVARFANHCCDPNCYTTIIKSGGKPRVVLYSKRSIEPGEEITYNYNFDVDEDESLRIRCHCGAKACKGYLN